MHNAVRSEAAPKNIDLAGEVGISYVVPTALISKLQKDVMGRVLWAEDPERYHDHEEAEHVSDERCRLQLWQKFAAPCVEDDCDEYDEPHEEGD